MNVHDKRADFPAISAAIEHEGIARRAYELWERDGRVEGNAERHWREAECEVRGTAPREGNPANPSLATRERMVSENEVGTNR